ncbi:MAG: choice-of-anchor tandem repeat GloVer-containing protein [Bryobacteraceae bacterium]
MTMHFRRTGSVLVLFALAGSLAPAAGQATFRLVASMYRYQQPAGIIEGSPGVFYSVAGSEPTVVFSVTTAGAMTVVGSIPTGYGVGSQVQNGADGRFYSEFIPHGNAAAYVFSVTAAPGGQQVYAAQTIAPVLFQNLPDGDILGTAIGLDASPWYVAKVGLNGSVTSIYQLPAEQSAATAAYANDGNYYAVSLTTTSTSGSIIRVTPSGVATTLYSFPVGSFSGNYPVPLLQASDSNLYGVTPTGGANGTGTIYKLTLGGEYTLLYTFPKNQTSNPNALIEGSDGNLYGATLGLFQYGELFRVTKSGTYTVLHAMSNPSASGSCHCTLVQGSDGTIYGTAQGGGAYGAGAVFALDVGLPKPAPRAQHFSPASAAAGTRVLLWGSNLLSPSVQFNGIAATTVSNSGSNYILATVPTGATTGPITITTPGGTVTTKESFTVE